MNKVFVSVFFLPALLFASSANDPPITTYHSTVSEVRVTFFTTDENNRTIETVKKEDFAIVDGDRVVRQFRSLMHANETELDVMVMLDTSESVASRFPAIMNNVLNIVSQKQIAADDRLSVLWFAGLQPGILCSGDCRSLQAQQRLLALHPTGATPMFDALQYSANFVSGRRIPGIRPVVVLFSDGDDTISKTPAADALQALIASGALLYVIDTNPPGSAAKESANLRQMAEATGGRYFSMKEGAANVLQAALEDLRASYVVTYNLPSRKAGFHSLRILPKYNLNLQFHCRSGYYYGNDVP